MLEPMSTTTDVKRADNAISAAIPERTSSSRTGLLAVLFIGFILSGIATTIVGPMLPVFIRRWGLDDGQAGLFSTIQFLSPLVGTGISRSWWSRFYLHSSVWRSMKRLSRARKRRRCVSGVE